MYKSIYIVETVGQVKYILDNHKKLSNENYYISITPIVHAKLSVNNYNVISYTDIGISYYKIFMQNLISLRNLKQILLHILLSIILTTFLTILYC